MTCHRFGLLLGTAARFRRIRGRDRALVLAGQAFTTLVPVTILAAGAVGVSRDTGLADELIERLRLGGSAGAVRELFTRPPSATGAMSLLSVLMLTVSLLGFTRTLQTTYETAWELSPCGFQGLLHGLGGTGLFVAQASALALLTSALRGLPVLPLAGTVIRTAAAVPVWLVLQYLLTSRRVPLRALWPGALLAAAAQGLVILASGWWMPGLVARNAARYGLIGVTFALLSWLIVLAVATVVAAALGAELGLPAARGYHPGVVANDESPVPADGTGLPPRFAVRFNEVYRADGYGHVAVWFAGGRTGRVNILVGPNSPPTGLAGEVTTEMPSSCAAVIRPGEYWMLECDRKNGGGFKAVFTPM